MKTLDLTLYHAVKAKFPLQSGRIGVVRLDVDLDAMEMISFSAAEMDRFERLHAEYLANDVPYALVDGVRDEPVFIYVSLDFGREECLATGRLNCFYMDPYHREFRANKEKILKELAALGKLLAGDS